MTAPLLVIAVGNRSRGDDALGPLLLDALRAGAPDGVELLEEFQLQVEHALDLVGRRAVLFVDASRAPVPGGAQLAALAPQHGHPPASHALAPAAVLGVFEQVQGQRPPPAWLLAVQGEAFGLGEGLGDAARQHLARAIELTRAWLEERR
ncbi:hydrogenase maturation protease [Piscinibacter defluvii]|uniref:hydrogenase maturation protease n=1 Tax=Piscinibacter defluvii TaxID=1796922 RepID=UPI000FDF28EF|nr:hydrogenase maturation protease [Piscinibacter defluvii]